MTQSNQTQDSQEVAQTQVLELAALTVACPCLKAITNILDDVLTEYTSDICDECAIEVSHGEKCSCRGSGEVPRFPGLQEPNFNWESARLGKDWGPVSIPDAAGVLMRLPEFISVIQLEEGIYRGMFWGDDNITRHWKRASDPDHAVVAAAHSCFAPKAQEANPDGR